MSYAPKQTLEEGYNKFVIKNKDGCWGWSGCKANPGYGQFRHGGKRERAHRASWIIHFGSMPDGMCVLHKCDNRECSKPEHLFLGTNLDNIKDMISKNRHPTLGKSGEENHKSKLNEDIVRQIRALMEIEKSHRYNRRKQIAAIFDIHPGTVSSINMKKTWKDLQ